MNLDSISDHDIVYANVRQKLSKKLRHLFVFFCLT